MNISSLDTHEIVKDLQAAGFTDEQAEAVTRAVKQAQNLDLSNLATKTDLAELRNATKTDLAELRNVTKMDLAELRNVTTTDLAELRAELIKWVVGVGFAQVAMILAVLKLLPGAHP
jgi:hypothetical protein